MVGCTQYFLSASPPLKKKVMGQNASTGDSEFDVQNALMKELREFWGLCFPPTYFSSDFLVFPSKKTIVKSLTMQNWKRCHE